MCAAEPRKESIYRWIRLSGLVTLIPIVLAAGPLAGYYAGDWLCGRFGLPRWVSLAGMVAGLLGGIRETVTIIRAALRETR